MDSHAGAEYERLDEYATENEANHDHPDCHKKVPLYTIQTVSLIDNDSTL